jgi:hypothetical protein
MQLSGNEGHPINPLRSQINRHQDPFSHCIKIATTDEGFLGLPQELRNKTWRFAIPLFPRTIEVRQLDYKKEKVPREWYIGAEQNPY